MHNSSKIVLFDIDYTVFNTDAYLLALRNQFAAFLQISHTEAEILIQDAIAETKRRASHFDPEIFLTEIGKRTQRSHDLQHLSTIFWDKEIYSRAIYEEVENVFSSLREKNITIGILSTGNERHQRQKIDILATLLSHEHIHIFINKLQEMVAVIDRYKDCKIFVIDDLPSVLSEAKRIHKDTVTIQVSRQKHFEVSDAHDTIKPDFTISSLREIVPIVFNN